MTDGPLAGIRVAEFGSGLAVGYATRVLADLGAEVLKVETANGDPIRSERIWRYLGASKRSIVADPGQVTADVIVESLGPGGVDVDELTAMNQRVVVVRISPFGQHGPYASRPVTDLVLQALAGWVNRHGIPDLDPVMVGGRLAELTAGSFAATAALTGLRAARDRGEAVVADLSMLECLVGSHPYQMLQLAQLAALGMPDPERRRQTLPGIVRATDGWVGLNTLSGQNWHDLCAMVGATGWEDRNSDVSWDEVARSEFYAELQTWLDQMTVADVVDLGQAFRIPAAPVSDAAQLLDCPQLEARQWFVDDPSGGGVLPGPPYRLSRSPVVPLTAPPALGEFDASDAARPFDDRSASLPPEGPTDATYLPFAGLRILELGTYWAGPYAGCYLGAMGADVIKIESVQRPDSFRFAGAFPDEGPDWHERSGLWQCVNLNKRDLTLDLTQPEGKRLLESLVATCDVVIENFSARVIDNFGLGYDELCRVRPDLVMVRMPGFGLEGPWRDFVGWAMNLEQAAGLAWLTGDSEGEPRNPGGFIDAVVGQHAVCATLAALEHRTRTGEGQMVEVAQFEVASLLSADQIIEFVTEQRVPTRAGNRSDGMAPQGVYPCRGGWVALSIRDDADWNDLVEILGSPPWTASVELRTLRGRVARHDEIDQHLAAWTSDQAPSDIVDSLSSKGIPVGELLTPANTFSEPQLVARGWLQELDHPITGARIYPGWPVVWSWPSAGHHRSSAPTLGQHNVEILGDGGLGLDQPALDRLLADQVIGDWPAQFARPSGAPVTTSGES